MIIPLWYYKKEYQQLEKQINEEKDVTLAICPKCKEKTSFKYQSSRSSYLEEWYRCKNCDDTFQPLYLLGYNQWNNEELK